MKKFLLLLVVSFFVEKNCEAQNLVPNPSFEDTVNCYTSTGWELLRGTPDYFNPCEPTGFQSVPTNIVGIQIPVTGLSYSGILNGYFPYQSYREIIGCQLLTPLVQGNKYFAIIKVSFADSSDVASNKIGISFSTVLYNSISAPVPINNQAIFYSSTIITDTTNWIIISGEFISDSAYSYLIIGNFFDDSLTSTITGLSNQDFSGMSYYYIDDVSVSPDSLACDLNPEGTYNLKETKASINLYPNPATNQLTVESAGSQQYAVPTLGPGSLISSIEITNSLGVEIYAESVNLKSKIINLKSFPSGIYFIKLYFGDGELKVKKLVKE